MAGSMAGFMGRRLSDGASHSGGTHGCSVGGSAVVALLTLVRGRTYERTSAVHRCTDVLAVVFTRAVRCERG